MDVQSYPPEVQPAAFPFKISQGRWVVASFVQKEGADCSASTAAQRYRAENPNVFGHIGVWRLDSRIIGQVTFGSPGSATVAAQSSPSTAQPTRHALTVTFSPDSRIVRAALQIHLAWNANVNGPHYLTDEWLERFDIKPRRIL